MLSDPYQLCFVLWCFTIAFVEPSHLDGNLSLFCAMEKIGQLTEKKKKSKMAYFPSTFMMRVFLMQNL